MNHYVSKFINVNVENKPAHVSDHTPPNDPVSTNFKVNLYLYFSPHTILRTQNHFGLVYKKAKPPFVQITK